MSRFIRPIIWSQAVGSTLMVAVALKFSFSFMICSLPLIFSEEKNSPFKVSNPFPSSVCCVLCAAVHWHHHHHHQSAHTPLPPELARSISALDREHGRTQALSMLSPTKLLHRSCCSSMRHSAELKGCDRVRRSS